MTATAIDRTKDGCFGPGPEQIDQSVLARTSPEVCVGQLGELAGGAGGINGPVTFLWVARRAAVSAVRVAALLAAAAFPACQSVDIHGEIDETTSPPSCMDCHGHEYHGTSVAEGKDPAPLDHAKAGIGTGCAACHTKEAWQPAVASGHVFPIESGVHKAACGICHNQPTNFSAFTCSTGFCHPNFKLKKQHSKVADFSSESGACLHCHPEGK